MLATLKEVLEKAEQGNYAVGAFNCTSLESGMAIVETAEELNSPVILQYADSHRHLISIDVIGPIMLQLAKIAKVPVVVHLDHGASIESCRHAVDMGFTSVMYDASAKPFEDNVAETRSVVEYAHERGASVEAELGHILTSKAGAAEGNGKSYTREEAYTDPEMAKEFIERTNVDALAIAETGAKAIQLHTGGMCHLDAKMTEQGIEGLGIEDVDLAILENVGNLVCPAEFDTGASKNVMILSVPEGHDKPLKYPLMFEVCDAVLINKIDVLPYFDFDMELVKKYIYQRNPKAEIFPVSAKTGEGIEAWTTWLKKQIADWKS